jgi:hypothetical protein
VFFFFIRIVLSTFFLLVSALLRVVFCCCASPHSVVDSDWELRVFGEAITGQEMKLRVVPLKQCIILNYLVLTSFDRFSFCIPFFSLTFFFLSYSFRCSSKFHYLTC